MKIVLVTGGFDPLHSGHIEYFKEARKLGDQLIVGVNSDAWLERKKGRAFMPFRERSVVVSMLDPVDAAYSFDDSDGSAIEFIKFMKRQYPNDELIFANGGDRTKDNIPEMSVEGVEFVFGVGGENKMNSSSWILEEWKAPKTERQWGYYRVLHEVEGCKVKELTVLPGESLSVQKHFKRNEWWIVTEGKCTVHKTFASRIIYPHETITIPVGDWHQITNPFDEPCRIVEVQYGTECIEEDIERKEDGWGPFER
jgi:cytidyltransferase-like protein